MARGEYPSAKQDQFVLRFPDGLRDRIKSEASRNGRSLNAELVFRLDAFDHLTDQVEGLIKDLENRDRMLFDDRARYRDLIGDGNDLAPMIEAKQAEIDRLRMDLVDSRYVSAQLRRQSEQLEKLEKDAVEVRSVLEQQAESLRLELRAVREKLANEEGKSISLGNALNMFFARLGGSDVHKSGLLDAIIEDVRAGRTLNDLAEGKGTMPKKEPDR